jgi:hypothetical protein
MFFRRGYSSVVVVVQYAYEIKLLLVGGLVFGHEKHIVYCRVYNIRVHKIRIKLIIGLKKDGERRKVFKTRNRKQWTT